MKVNEVNRLIERYLNGETSPAEEALLALEVNRPDAPAHWRIVAHMLGELTLCEALYNREQTLRRKHRLSRLITRWAVAASLAGVVFAGGWAWHRSQTEDIAVAYINNSRVDDEQEALSIGKDALCEIFSNGAPETELNELFNPE